MPQTISYSSKHSKGFTIIELLVVIVVVGILSAVLLSVVNIPATQARTRDNIRIADLKKIMFALNLYYGDRRQYPSIAPGTTAIYVDGTDLMSRALLGTLAAPDNVAYIAAIPVDPKTPTNNNLCDSVAGGYFYYTPATRDYAVMATEMEQAASVGSSTCASVNANLCGGSPTSVCYAIRSN